MNKSRKTYEIIFVDDDSKDNSFNVFKKFKNQKTKFLKRIKKPRDLSKSVVYGFQRAKYNNFVVMDGDLQHSPEDLRKLMRLFEQKNCDIIFKLDKGQLISQGSFDEVISENKNSSI